MFQFYIENVGSIPAYDVRINKSILTGAGAGVYSDQQSQVIFPNDVQEIHSGFTVKIPTEELKAALSKSGVWLNYRFGYRGIDNAEYFTEYRLHFPDPYNCKIVKMAADTNL